MKDIFRKRGKSVQEHDRGSERVSLPPNEVANIARSLIPQYRDLPALVPAKNTKLTKKELESMTEEDRKNIVTGSRRTRRKVKVEEKPKPDPKPKPKPKAKKPEPEKYEILEIRDKKKINNKWYYRVKWKKYRKLTWNDAKITKKDVPKLVQEFEKKWREKQRKKK